jgi:hypothetical protein
VRWSHSDADHLKVTIPTAFAVSRLAWVCKYHRNSLEALTFHGTGTSDFGAMFGVKSNSELFGGQNIYEWCKREVTWGARWLEQAHFQSSDRTVGIAVQVRTIVALYGTPFERVQCI